MWSMLKNSATLIQFTPAEVWSMLIYNDANFENVKILLLVSASTITTTKRPHDQRPENHLKNHLKTI